MKKATLNRIYNTLKDIQFINKDEVLAELSAEINKGEEQKAKNAAVYTSFHDIVMDALSDTPVTLAELWESIEDEVPEGVTKGKVQYAITRLWKDEVKKVDGSPNSYCKA